MQGFAIIWAVALGSTVACVSLLALTAAGSSSRVGTPGDEACPLTVRAPRVCSFEMLTFYYDDDDSLQCECGDEGVGSEDWCLARGFE